MKRTAIDLHRWIANFVVCAALIFSWGQAHAGDTLQVASVALPATAAAPIPAHPIMLPAMTVGGVAAGQVLMITERSSEVIDAANLTQKQGDIAARLASRLTCGF